MTASRIVLGALGPVNTAEAVAELYADERLDLTDWRDLDDDALLRLLWNLDTGLGLEDLNWLVTHRDVAAAAVSIAYLVGEAS